MNMINHPDQINLFTNYLGIGGYGNYHRYRYQYQYQYQYHPMAEDESRTDTTTTTTTATTTSAASSSKNINDADNNNQGWLQLSIGGVTPHNNIPIIKQQQQQQQHVDEQEQDDEEKERSRRLIELDLLPPSNTNINSPMFFHHPPPPPTQIPIFPRPTILTTPNNPYNTTSSSSSSTAMVFQHHPGGGGGGGGSLSMISSFQDNINYNNLRGFGGSWSSRNSTTSLVPSFIPSTSSGVSGSGIDFRVIDPPRQPHSGIWFMLQPAQNQTKEPYLPQIQKNFLRIKDGRITIRLVQKYLVNKLKLENESEIEIRCRGQKVEAFLTLQHVRDNIWRMIRSTARDQTLTLFPNSSTIDHIMLLNYARSTPS